jgi:hypothetical protein
VAAVARSLIHFFYFSFDFFLVFLFFFKLNELRLLRSCPWITPQTRCHHVEVEAKQHATWGVVIVVGSRSPTNAYGWCMAAIHASL